MRVLILLAVGACALDFSTCVADRDFSGPCVKLMLSKVMGSALVLFSTIVKLPQILKIISAKSVSGLSATSFYTELLSFGTMAAYSCHNGQPLSTYGECVTIFLQCAVQVALLWTYGRYRRAHIYRMLLFFTAVFGALASGLLPESFWQLLILAQFPFNLIVKGSQIFTNFSQGHTGQLSLITNALNFAGTCVRIFTTLVEVADRAVLLNYAMTTALNFTILAQIWLYWNVKEPQVATKESKHE